MFVAFPTQEDRGLDSAVYGHFGSAACFVIVETDTQTCVRVVNRDRDHAHGQCRPLDALGGESVAAVVVGGIGGGAIRQLSQAGVKVFRAVQGTIRDNLDFWQQGHLPELTLDHACVGHHHDGGCAH